METNRERKGIKAKEGGGEMINQKQYPRVIYGVSTEDIRAVAFEGDAVWRVVEIEGMRYRPLTDRPELDKRWDVLLDQISEGYDLHLC